MIRSFVIFVTLALAASAAQLDVERLADAVRTREGYHGRPGALGEAGPWQIREMTWRQHMGGKPFAAARQEGPARACALKHLGWLRDQLQARGVDGSAFNVAVAWNAGLEQYLSGRAPVRAYRYAADVVRLYDLLGATALSDKPTVRTSDERSGVSAFPRVCLPSTDHRADRLQFHL